jgi:hypothetical protein
LSNLSGIATVRLVLHEDDPPIFVSQVKNGEPISNRKRFLKIAIIFDYFVLNDIPRLTAIAWVARGVRFKVLAIFFTPCLSFAIDFNVRKSSFVHARRTTFFFFAISGSFLRTRAFITSRNDHLATQRYWKGAV